MTVSVVRPRKSIFSMPAFSRAFMSYWRDDDRLVVARAGALRRLRADGHVVVERTRRDHDAGRVHAGVARQPFERHRVVEQLRVALVVAVELLDLGDLLDRFLRPSARSSAGSGSASRARPSRPA